MKLTVKLDFGGGRVHMASAAGRRSRAAKRALCGVREELMCSRGDRGELARPKP